MYIAPSIGGVNQSVPIRTALAQSWMERIAFSRRAWIALLALCLAVYLPGLFTIPPIDRDESRFAQASRQMFESVAFAPESQNQLLHSGGIAIPYVMDRPRLNKPPLIYWLQSASAAIFTGGDPLRDAIWMYRIPGVLCAIGAVLATWRVALSMTGRLAAFVAAAALAVCPVVVLDAHQARADQLLLLTVVLAQGLLWQIFRGDRNWSTVLLFWIAIACGILAKGPITPMIAALTALFLAMGTGQWRWLRTLRPLIGLVVVILAVAPWVITVAKQVGWSSYISTIWDETIGRSVEGKEGHWGPPGYHVLLVFFLLWPIALGLPGIIVCWWKRFGRKGGSTLGHVQKELHARPAEAFLLSWAVPAWIVFEFVSTKLPHYTLPLYPAFCILGARVIVSIWRVRRREGTPRDGFLHLTRLWFGTGIVVLVGIGAMAFSLSWWPALGWWSGNDAAPRTNWLLVPVASAMLVGMIVAGRFLAKMQIMRSLMLAWCALGIGYMLLLGAVAPSALSLSTRIASSISDRETHPPVLLAGYQEDSLVFLLRGNTRRIEYRQLAEAIVQKPGLAVVGLPLPPDMAGKEEVVQVLRAEFRGLNVAKSRCQSVGVAAPGSSP